MARVGWILPKVLSPRTKIILSTESLQSIGKFTTAHTMAPSKGSQL